MKWSQSILAFITTCVCLGMNAERVAAADWTWIDATADHMPFDAVVGGSEGNGDRLYICRAGHQNGIYPENSVRAFKAAISAPMETKSQYPTSKSSFQPGHLLQMAAFLGKPRHSGMKLMAPRSSYAERTTRAAFILEGSVLVWAGATLAMAGRRFSCPTMRC